MACCIWQALIQNNFFQIPVLVVAVAQIIKNFTIYNNLYEIIIFEFQFFNVSNFYSISYFENYQNLLFSGFSILNFFICGS